jgi:hypothetical protein
MQYKKFGRIEPDVLKGERSSEIQPYNESDVLRSRVSIRDEARKQVQRSASFAQKPIRNVHCSSATSSGHRLIRSGEWREASTYNNRTAQRGYALNAVATRQPQMLR